jgi:hypothetical protein
MKPVFREKSQQMLSNLDTVSGSVDLQQFFFQYTLDSFGQIGFGLESFHQDVLFISLRIDMVRYLFILIEHKDCYYL